MRLSSVLVAGTSSAVVSATWLKWSAHENREPVAWLPQETGHASVIDETKGWTPRPTTAPGPAPPAEAVLDLLRARGAVAKRQASSSTWENDQTCGWVAGISSDPWTCGAGSKCSTNAEHVVACVSGTFEPFFTVCLDYQAFLGGACGTSIGSQTGCCQTSSFGACGTLLWTGTPVRSMYRCFAKSTIISINDQPQFVIDAATQTSSTSSSTSSSTPTSTGGTSDNSSGGSSTNVGAIVGGVVGGVAALALIAGLIAWFLLRGRKHDKQAPAATTTPPTNPSAVAQHNLYHPGAPSPQMSQAGYGHPPSTTFPPTSPYASTAATAFDPRASYYDSTKQPGEVTPGQQQHLSAAGQHPGMGASPPHSPGMPGGAAGSVAGSYNPHHSVLSELDSTNMRAGHQDNPVEMAADERNEAAEMPTERS